MKAPLNLVTQRPTDSRGMALIEALVALAVMAFGLLGVVGMQATLRVNADVSRQRAEAVRMAQEHMETLRSFGALSGAVSGGRDYAAITTVGATTLTPPAGFTNTTFTRTVTVVNPGADDPKMKSVTVEVAWRDRRTAAAGTAEVVRLMSTVAGAPPELATTLGLPGDQSAPQQPRGRNISIPPGAIDQGNGTSSFAPPGAAVGTTWTFSNATGQITEICPPAIPCITVQGWLLSGYINFATGNLPSATEAEFPTDGVPAGRSIGIQLNTTTSPTPAVSSVCYSQASLVNPVVAYNCFVPTTNVSPATWSGQSLVTIDGATNGPLFATSHSVSFSANEFKVCRYTNQASHTPTSGGNTAHPLTYTNVNSSLVNQNFLVISAGDVNSPFAPFTCPSPLSSGHTFPHQPSS